MVYISWQFDLFLPLFFNFSGGFLVNECVRKAVPAFSNMLEWAPREKIQLMVMVEVIFTKNLKKSTFEKSAKIAILGPKTPLFHPYEAHQHSQ